MARREDEPIIVRVDRSTGETEVVGRDGITEEARDAIAKAFARIAARSAMEAMDEPDALWRALEDLDRTTTEFVGAMTLGLLAADGSEDDAVHTIESLTAMSQSARSAIRSRLDRMESYRIDDEEGGE